MISVGSVVIALLVILNLYVSVKILRDDFSTRTQKLLQLCFVWLLPVMGAVLTAILVSGTRHPTVDVPSQSGMELVNYWHSSEGSNYGSDINNE
jgi:hypothetical protein